MQSFVRREAFVWKIHRELWIPKCARKVSGLSRNGPLVFPQVFRSIGYKSISIDEQVPFDTRRGVIPNIDGRVVRPG